MSSQLVVYIKAERQKRGLTVMQLAGLIGLPNVRKTGSRIARFEAEGIIKDDLLAALAEALEIDLPTVERLMEQDRQEQDAAGNCGGVA